MANPRPRLEILTESFSYFALVMRLAAAAYTLQSWMLRELAGGSRGYNPNFVTSVLHFKCLVHIFEICMGIHLLFEKMKISTVINIAELLLHFGCMLEIPNLRMQI